ncbi:hypothetical protein GM160_05560 [Guyparkeria halophila]|uniref:Uncharacterized protein n=1 Tax=Guyparkeria halophila TaxID=47960 RepID=A0A6I6D2H3_9GAMM|nr:hypothetical protein [Guyparkeria halophila]QGT78405.1 hypothetical protein GM160_05560 [Guyparkeria halophila]
MTANHRNGGRAVGAGTSDLRNPPASTKPQFHDVIACMRHHGLVPAAAIRFIDDGVARQYRVDGDPPGVARAFYIALPRNAWGVGAIAFGDLAGGTKAVCAPQLPPNRQEAVRAFADCQLSHVRNKRGAREVCR